MESAFKGRLTLEAVEEPKPEYNGSGKDPILTALFQIMKAVPEIEKLGYNEEDDYAFVAMDDLLPKLRPAMMEAGLIIIPSEMSHEHIASMIAVTFCFKLFHEPSGLIWKHQPVFTGVAIIDDKAFNKCLTAARKYFLISLFSLVTKAVLDADRGRRKVVNHEAGGDPREEDEGVPINEKRANAENWVRAAIAAMEEIKDKTSLFLWESRNSDAVFAVASRHPDLSEKLRAARDNHVERLKAV